MLNAKFPQNFQTPETFRHLVLDAFHVFCRSSLFRLLFDYPVVATIILHKNHAFLTRPTNFNRVLS